MKPSEIILKRAQEILEERHWPTDKSLSVAILEYLDSIADTDTIAS